MLAHGTAVTRLAPWVSGVIVVSAEVAGLEGTRATFRTEVENSLEWPPVSRSAGTYERAEYSDDTFVDHGTFSERYVLEEDGRSRLQLLSGRLGFDEEGGIHSHDGAGLEFAFAASPQWRATGTFEGGCLDVEYNIVMWFAGFESGRYCPPADSP